MVKYDTSKFHGVFVALNASYDANGELNTEKLKELALWYHSLGVKGLYVCGSTGEGMLLTAEERKASVKAVCEAVGGKLVILCHVGAPSTRQAVELAKHAESCGVDAVSAVPSISTPKMRSPTIGTQLRRLSTCLSSFTIFLSLPAITFPAGCLSACSRTKRSQVSKTPTRSLIRSCSSRRWAVRTSLC